MMTFLKNEFLINPEIVYLNHGSFGATPKIVFDEYQAWQRRLEHQPVHFIVRELLDHFKYAREILADYLHAEASDLVFIPNATFGVNVIARSLELKEGEEILSTDHEYGACDNVWEFICSRSGASYKRLSISLPVTRPEEFVEQFWRGRSSKTKAIYLSHISSSTAQCFPVKLICERARSEGIISIIDGAHTPGQIPLDLTEIDADFYVGNCHKWMLSPKGSGFLYTRHDRQKMIDPLVVSWGWGKNSPYTTGSEYLDNLEWWGTYDPSAYLAVPAAIQFMDDNDWTSVREDCENILSYAIKKINSLTGLQSMYSDGLGFPPQMAVVLSPHLNDLEGFQSRLLSDYHIEIPCIKWNEQQFIRISIQAYNTQADVDKLLTAMGDLLPEFME